MATMNFKVLGLEGTSNLEFNYQHVFIIGYAGRNMEKTMEHIKELEEQLGVAPPKRIPTIFESSHEQLTQSENLLFLGEDTCGEVEYVILYDKGDIYIGVGSDHTDRKLESISVPKAKQICAKPIGRELWKYEEIKDHWNSILLVSHQKIDGEEILYQDGGLKDILPVEKILCELKERVQPFETAVIYSGTVPLKAGFVYGDQFRGIMKDPVLNREITFQYQVDVISEGER